jgi:hypothetical protein
LDKLDALTLRSVLEDYRVKFEKKAMGVGQSGWSNHICVRFFEASSSENWALVHDLRSQEIHIASHHMLIPAVSKSGRFEDISG